MSPISQQQLTFDAAGEAVRIYAIHPACAPGYSNPDDLARSKKAAEDRIILEALAILESRVHSGPVLDSPAVVKDFLRLKLAPLEHEVFAVLFLDSQLKLISYEEMFRGTTNQTSVYPREVVKRSLSLNSSAVILAHNHPSNSLEPSRADEYLTSSIKSALALIDVRVIDHLVVGATGVASFAERGLL